MTTSTTSRLTTSDVRWLVAQASRAPSIHNTQPWQFRWTGSEFELRGDTSRGLTATDPTGRELVVSCGAALFNLRLALRKLGHRGVVTNLPDRSDPRLLAVVRVEPDQPADAETRRLYAAMTRRHTHRGDFEDRPLAAELAVRLQQAAEQEGCELIYVHDPGQRRRVLHLARAAERQLSADPAVREEILQWTPERQSRRRDGIPTRAYAADLAPGADDLPPRDFDLERRIGQAAESAQPPGGIAVLTTSRDLELDWLQAGQGLENVLVVAAGKWAYAAIHSQVTEVQELREELRRELCTAWWPQILLRFGYAGDAPATPRRPVDEVLAIA